MNTILTRMLSTAILISIIISNIQDTNAKEIKYNYCDKVFAKSWFEEVAPDLNKLCRNRFIWNTNRDKYIMRRLSEQQVRENLLSK